MPSLIISIVQRARKSIFKKSLENEFCMQTQIQKIFRKTSPVSRSPKSEIQKIFRKLTLPMQIQKIFRKRIRKKRFSKNLWKTATEKQGFEAVLIQKFFRKSHLRNEN